MTLQSRRFIHEVAIEALLGDGAYGSSFAPAVTVACRVEPGRRLNRGDRVDEAADSTTVFASYATVCPVGSRVTLPDGRTVTAVQVEHLDGSRLAHVEITCE